MNYFTEGIKTINARGITEEINKPSSLFYFENHQNGIVSIVGIGIVDIREIFSKYSAIWRCRLYRMFKALAKQNEKKKKKKETVI